MKCISIFSFGFIFMMIGCSSLEDPDKVVPDDILNLTVQGQSQIIGNGRTKIAFVARLPEAATQQEVTFTTSGGNFAYNNLKVIKQFADSVSGNYRYTRTVLRSDTVKGIVYITAETPLARRRVNVTFTR